MAFAGHGGWKQLDRLTNLNEPSVSELAIQRKLAPETLDDIAQHVRVRHKCIGIEGGHDASTAKIRDVDHYVADDEFAALPQPFIEAVDSAHHNVGPETAAVAPKLHNSSVGCDKEGITSKRSRPSL